MKIEKSHPKISFYRGPVTNLLPHASITLCDVYRGLVSGYYQALIEQLRACSGVEEKRNIKKQLDYVTFAGTFKSRKCENLLRASTYLCIDLDHLEEDQLNPTKERLLNDSLFETELLFTSPGGKGLKWVVAVDLESYDYTTNYLGVLAYLKKVHHLGAYIDTTGKDIARACFMSHDPEAYLHPKYLNER
ncbi:BT4734/BF3469 family protein [Roseimarinus sediminis]|uniref:BT4734/BF3469 family protein n=1 Tax=Roseimarinus sediminis TaxID=1610899 RepID=UPI003D251276